MPIHFLKSYSCLIRLLIIAGIIFLSDVKLFSQTPVVYDFNNTLSDTSGKYPTMQVLDRIGVFKLDTLKELNGIQKTVYEFDINSGISFDNKEAAKFLKGDYTIELYFKLDIYNSWKRVVDFKNKKADTGPYIYFRKVSFYKTQTEDIPHIKPGEYISYVISRDFNSKEVKIYIDGINYLTFKDAADDGVMNPDNRLNFFHDNHSMGNEASAGAIALCKIYGTVLPEQMVKTNYQNLPNTFISLNKHKHTRPKSRVLVKGNIYDAKNGAPMASKITISLASDSTFVNEFANDRQTGNYAFTLPSGRFYSLTATADGYIDYEDLLDLSSTDSLKPIIRDIAMNRMEVGRTITLNKISFQQSKYDLLPSSFDELDKLVELMKRKPHMEIFLSGHTDNQGNAKLNVSLSENRVNAVKDYLVSKGIESHRIKGKGFGGAKPIASNTSEITRRQNRRVELTILKY